MGNPYYRILIRGGSFVILPMYWFDELFYRQDNFCLASSGEPLVFTSEKQASDYLNNLGSNNIPVYQLTN